MKKVFTLISLFCLISISVFSQSIDLGYHDGDINNGDTVVVFSTNNNADFDIHLFLSNNTTSTINILGKKTELNLVAGSDNMFCDWLQCYGSSTYVTSNSLALAVNDTNKGFTGEYRSNNKKGASYIMYTFWVENHTNDSVAVIIKYLAGSGVGISTVNKKANVSNAYPNPAKDYFFIDYEFENAQSAQIQILNVLGSNMITQSLSNISGKAKIDISKLENGIYFYNVIVDGRKVASKKLIVR